MNEKEEIFLRVLESHKGIIYKVANSHCNNSSEQDDLIQEIILQIWQSMENYNETYKWSTWIYRIALNTSISFYRKNKKRKENTVVLSPIIQCSDISEQDADDEDFLLLRSFVMELREIERALILLHLDGLSSKEIAIVLDTTQTNVTTKVSRIRNKLKRKFEEHKIKNHE